MDTESETLHIDWSAVPERMGISGIPIRLVNGEHLQLMMVELPVGYANLPHRHASEQVGYVLAGTIVYDIEGARIRCRAGDSYRIPPGRAHSIEVVGEEAARLLECFSPPREAYR